jgi:methionyl-tRNA formyltransferase
LLRVVLFGSGGAMPTASLRSLTRQHQVVAIVHPVSSHLRSAVATVLRPFRKQDTFRETAHELAIPPIGATSGRDVRMRAKLKSLNPDLICVASFPWLLGDEVISSARLGGINVHPSLLPRHRGPNPFFWTYYNDDHETGVTAHKLAPKADAGDILAQVKFDLPRGHSLNALHARVSKDGAELLAQVATEMEASRAIAIPQDESRATSAPKVKPGTPMTRFNEWPVERVWHFLAGLCPHFKEPLDGVVYGSVAGFTEIEHHKAMGSTEPHDIGWKLYCRGGYVQLSRSVSVS